LKQCSIGTKFVKEQRVRKQSDKVPPYIEFGLKPKGSVSDVLHEIQSCWGFIKSQMILAGFAF